MNSASSRTSSSSGSVIKSSTEYEFDGYYSYQQQQNQLSLSYGIFYSISNPKHIGYYLVRPLENIGCTQWLLTSDEKIDDQTVIPPHLENHSH